MSISREIYHEFFAVKHFFQFKTWVVTTGLMLDNAIKQNWIKFHSFILYQIDEESKRCFEVAYRELLPLFIYPLWCNQKYTIWMNAGNFAMNKVN